MQRLAGEKTRRKTGRWRMKFTTRIKNTGGILRAIHAAPGRGSVQKKNHDSGSTIFAPFCEGNPNKNK
jgi:hypothetical protein